DFAADLRAPTPSVAAELLVPNVVDIGTRVRGLHQRLDALHLQRMRDWMQRADRASLRLQALAPQARLRALGERQRQALRRLHAAWHAHETALRARLRHADAVLRATRPERR